MEVDWDLHAVVRACCSTACSATSSTATTAAAAGTPHSWPLDAYNQETISFHEDNLVTFFPDPFQPRNDNSIEQFLNNLKLQKHPLDFPKLQKPSQSLPISPLSVLGGLQDPPINHHHQQNHQHRHQDHHQHQHHQQEQKHVQGKQQAFGLSRCTTSNAQSTRSKKRKNQMKRVCQVPAEGLSSDVWSWRKYGQKPIKGSPYPRGYYRCSTSKGCLARKQVERNRSDPDTFIVTYTGEHSHPVPTHRNSLAGSTRNKPTAAGDEDQTTKHKPSSSPPVSPPASHSPATEKTEDNDTDDDNFDMVMDDDFFEGLDELVSPLTAGMTVNGDNDSNTSVIPATSTVTPSFPWLSNNLATKSTTAAGGS